ncbi:hypothetical protein [Pseudomonas phage PA1C]|uniref:Uncharacterized protein n=1 Tax=Pseudomonas phage vB_PaeM_PS119XW TaxID=2601632 RepID=A0A5C1K8S0_9CAUD|nr:hypothetical protein PP933_gp015 [Pseudomonas phage vB_PaeM_PS119XW]QBX32163.1 hypothetical protein [Pseudomonas phage PA1C]QEM41744.1 hypothetical protein [Pseudomonas phage vB_PaeM_PS119XW]BEG72655.1 hypothetical protein RVBP21_2830 [Pseudomonas phage BRkr]
MAITIPYTRLASFKNLDKNLRWGQAFHSHMELHKITNPEDKEWCDKLWNADDRTAADLLASVVDYNN